MADGIIHYKLLLLSAHLGPLNQLRQFHGLKDWDWVLIGVYNDKKSILLSPMKRMRKRTAKNSNWLRALIVRLQVGNIQICTEL